MLSRAIEKVAKRNEGPYFGEILDTMSDKEYDSSKRFSPDIARGCHPYLQAGVTGENCQKTIFDFATAAGNQLSHQRGLIGEEFVRILRFPKN